MKRIAKDKNTGLNKRQGKYLWRLNRKQFLKTVAAGGLLVQIPFQKAVAQMLADNPVLDKNQLGIIQSVQEILFPSDGNGPGSSEINAPEYLMWVLSDPEKDPAEIEYIINGIGWVDESAEEQFSEPYTELTQTEKEQLILSIAKEGWGESWLSVILSFIFEALLCDPQYPGNPEHVGWAWLGHQPGQPRPTKNLLYPEILKTIRKP